MITKTVGAGGDYALWSDAWNYLCSIDPLTDDYEFRQISTITENAWPDVTIAANKLDANGHSIKFYCDFADSHKGDSTKGFITNLSGAGGRINFYFITSNFTMTCENIYFKHLTDTTQALGLFSILSIGTITQYFYAKNILIEGKYTSNTSDAFSMPAQCLNSYVYVSNIKIWNCYDGISCGIAGSASTVLLQNFFENISIKTVRYGVELISGQNIYINFKNCVAFGATGGGSYDWAAGINAQKQTLNNCADSDNSIANGTSTNVNCITGITSADFLSVVSTSSDFLRLNQFSYLSSSSPIYLGTSKTFSVDISCTSKLWKTGTAAISAWNTEDIIGNQRPNNDGTVCIGAYEKWEIVSYSWDLDDGLTSTDASPTVSYTTPGIKNISVTIIFSDGSTSTLTDSFDVYAYSLNFSGDNLSGPVKLKTTFTPIFEP
jgi:hypothetical protein